MNTIDVYYFSIDNEGYPEDIEALHGILDEKEQARYARYKFEKDRYCFLYSRYVLKRELAQRLGCAIESIRFSYTEYGKPYLEGNPLYFNLAHCQSAIAFAVSQQVVGIDIEAIERHRSLSDSLSSSFHESVAAYIQSQDSLNKRIDMFANYWTCLEAYVKLNASTLFSHIGNFGDKGLHIGSEHYFSYDQTYFSIENIGAEKIAIASKVPMKTNFSILTLPISTVP